MKNEVLMPNGYQKFYTSYKGLWYRYHPLLDQWWISDTQDGAVGNIYMFSSKEYRIDQCFTKAAEMWSEEFLKNESNKWNMDDNVAHWGYLKSETKFLGIEMHYQNGAKQFFENKSGLSIWP